MSQVWYQYEGYELCINSGSKGKLSDKVMERGAENPHIFESASMYFFSIIQIHAKVSRLVSVSRQLSAYHFSFEKEALA